MTSAIARARLRLLGGCLALVCLLGCTTGPAAAEDMEGTGTAGQVQCPSDSWVNTFPRGPLLDWRPQEGRYLLPLCQRGRLTNQLKCMHIYFWYAAFLGRTLLVPRLGFGGGVSASPYVWRWNILLDVPKARSCIMGANNSPFPPVVTMEEYLYRFGENQTEFEDTANTTGISSINGNCVVLEKVFALTQGHVVWMDSRLHNIPGMCEFNGSMQVVVPTGSRIALSAMDDLKQQSAQYRVISLGSAFYEQLEGQSHKALALSIPAIPFPVRKDCHDIWSPSPRLMSLVDWAIANLTEGNEYSAVHIRRGDFRRRVNYNTTEIANMLFKWPGTRGVSYLFLATDGDAAEVKHLQQLLDVSLATEGRKLKVVVLSQMHGDKTWDREIDTLEIGKGGVIIASIDKYVCARSKSFLGTPLSTFSEEIMRVRIAEQRASCFDTELGRGNLRS